MQPRLLRSVVDLSKARGLRELQRLSPRVVEEKGRLTGDEACQVATAYGRARCHSSEVFALCCGVLRRDIGVVDPSLFLQAHKELQACGWHDEVLAGLLLSELASPSSTLHHAGLAKPLAVEMLLFALQHHTPMRAAVLRRLASRLTDLSTTLTAKDIGRIAEGICRAFPADHRVEALGKLFCAALLQRGTEGVVVLTLTVRELSSALRLFASHGFLAAAASPPCSLHGRLLLPYYRQLTRPYSEASLVLMPPWCLAHAAVAYAILGSSSGAGAGAEAAALSAQAVAWCGVALEEHYVKPGVTVPPKVLHAMQHAARKVEGLSAGS